MTSCDVLVVGAGPIGLEVAVSLRSRGVDTVVVEAGSIGQTMTWWAPETKFFSSPERLEICGSPLIVAGQEKATGEQYLDYLRGVVAQNAMPVRTHERVVGFEKGSDGFVARTEGVRGPQRIGCKKLVLASGNMDAPRLIGVEGEELAHVSHYFEGPHHYFGRRVLIVGGKNSACEAALRLYRAGVDVAVSYRQAKFDPDRVKYWVRPELEWLIEKGKIGFLPETEPVKIEPGLTHLRGVDGAVRTHECDFVLLLTGYVQDKGLFEMLGVQTIGEEERPVFDHDTMETNVPGVYVAGTVCGGSQKRARVFIETSHVHAERIVAAVTGSAVEAEAPKYGRFEES